MGVTLGSSPQSTVAPAPISSPPCIVWLSDDAALDAELSGAKAANLAWAARHGLPVLAGFAITTAATEDGVVATAAVTDLRRAWTALTGGGDAVLVVRSSSTVEDCTTSSMAGQFTSVLGVRGWAALLDAVTAVLASARACGVAGTPRPMAVLIQPQLEPVCGGVMFGLDPVTGDRRHIVVEAVPGTPDLLVSGRVTAAHCVLGRRGRVVGGNARQHRALLPRSRRRRLVRLARHAADAFDGPQDLEWAFDDSNQLWLLQSRSVTATGDDAFATGPILGPGPVAETFPDPLRPLEIQLWVEALRAGVAGALHVTSSVSRRRLKSSPVVTAVGGWVAADLELFGIVPRGRATRRALNPLRGARRLFAAWRVGRLRAALPALAADLVAAVDADLMAVGNLVEFDDEALLELLGRAKEELVALHGHEVLAGMLLHGDTDRRSVATAALEALRQGRADGLSDEEVVARTPVVLALLPPTIGPGGSLPDLVPSAPLVSPATAGDLGCREALRLRCRWVQEIGARAARELGTRLANAGVLDQPDLVRELTLDELRTALLDHRVPDDVAARASVAAGAPLPVAFRLAPSSVPVTATPRRHDQAGGLAASGGRSTGVVCHDTAELTSSVPCVLVVETLDPRLAPALPHLTGLVSETGSALSHLAILARELHVPAVVAVPDARARFPAGSQILLDGGTGEVRAVRPTKEA